MDSALLTKIHLHKGKEISFLRFHPWIFSGAIKTIEGKPADGDLVEVYTADKKFAGIGYYQPGSIAIRIISFEQLNIDEAFWKNKIQKAFDYRKFLGLAGSKETNVYRLVFGEGDGLPGLIIDHYNGHLVIQCHGIGMHRNIEHIAFALKEVYDSSLQTIYDKSKETLPKNYASVVENRFISGSAGNTLVKENGHQFYIDWEKGQKTGFFIDQRENRQLLSGYSVNKKVLNTFCYTGGFSVYAGAAGANSVHSVDSSAPAMELTEKNMRLNELSSYENFCSDTFDFLKDKKDTYDVIILDPPAFAKSRDSKHNAVIGYKNLNIAALKQIKSGGILFTFSCSGVIDKNLFFNTINAAAFESKRKTKILHYLQQPADHPLTPNFPEGEYLKGLVLYVE
ncbi:MAG TPA: class I SAM-dependent rRNA methyltransferase [Bacteroidia bacterium]|jgi:23S rRNA (cytosine1962-C5)-methyltransferase|nr:class I SAM-dependent rRNA methyltransferase [Bacteroidia bacterium]